MVGWPHPNRKDHPVTDQPLIPDALVKRRDAIDLLRSAVLALADDWDDFEHDPITCPKYECSDCTMKNAVYDLRTCVWSITGGGAS